MITISLPILSVPVNYQGPSLPTPNQSVGRFISYASTFKHSLPLPLWISETVPPSHIHQVVSPGSLRRYEVVEREGDPAVGTVIFVRQIHGSEDDQRMDVRINTGMYQLQMMHELRRRYDEGVRDFFEEGVSEDRNLVGDDADFVRRIFPNIGYNPTREQLATLYQNPVIWTFSALFPAIQVRKVMNAVESAEERDMYLAYYEARRTIGRVNAERKFSEYMTTRREGRAVREMKEFLENNPGKTIVLVFGGAHDFSSIFELMDFRARLVSVWWDHPVFNKTRLLPPSVQAALRR